MNMVYKEKEPNGSICFYVCGIKVLSIKLQKWINLFMGIIQAPYINYKLAHCKYVHLMQPGDVNKTVCDWHKAHKLLNYTPKTSFEQGIRKFIQWRNEQ